MVLDQHDIENLKHKEHACNNCLNKKDFGESCWYFWHDKKDCSQKIPQ